jgi:hypothetical protein
LAFARRETDGRLIAASGDQTGGNSVAALQPTSASTYSPAHQFECLGNYHSWSSFKIFGLELNEPDVDLNFALNIFA